MGSFSTNPGNRVVQAGDESLDRLAVRHMIEYLDAPPADPRVRVTEPRNQRLVHGSTEFQAPQVRRRHPSGNQPQSLQLTPPISKELNELALRSHRRIL